MKNHEKITALVEGAVMLALAIVLSCLRIYKFPWGGSVTVLSMLPIAVYSIKYGLPRGLAISFLFALFQLCQGITDGLFGWGLTPVMLISCIMLDYLLPYTVIGIAGMLRKKGAAGWIAGITVAITARFLLHFISGVVIWHSFGTLWEGFSTENEWLYSLCYNGAYMLPELVSTVIGAVALFKVSVTRRLFSPVRVKENEQM